MKLVATVREYVKAPVKEVRLVGVEIPCDQLIIDEIVWDIINKNSSTEAVVTCQGLDEYGVRWILSLDEYPIEESEHNYIVETLHYSGVARTKLDLFESKLLEYHCSRHGARFGMRWKSEQWLEALFKPNPVGNSWYVQSASGNLRKKGWRLHRVLRENCDIESLLNNA